MSTYKVTDGDKRNYTNLSIIANSAQVSTNVVKEVAGNDISDSVEGVALTEQDISDLFLAKLNGYLTNPVGG